MSDATAASARGTAMTLRCVVCGQPVIVLSRAPREPDRHRWCSVHPGRHLPVGFFAHASDAPLLDRCPVIDDLTVDEIEHRFRAARAALRRAS